MSCWTEHVKTAQDPRPDLWPGPVFRSPIFVLCETSARQPQVEKLVVIQGIVASVKTPRDKVPGRKPCEIRCLFMPFLCLISQSSYSTPPPQVRKVVLRCSNCENVEEAFCMFLEGFARVIGHVVYHWRWTQTMLARWPWRRDSLQRTFLRRAKGAPCVRGQKLKGWKFAETEGLLKDETVQKILRNMEKCPPNSFVARRHFGTSIISAEKIPDPDSKIRKLM